MISELTSGTSFIPETVTVLVPSTKKVLEDYISDRKKQMSDFLKKTSLSLRNSDDVFIKKDDMICIYINPVDKSFFELVKKKTTSSNNLMAQLARSCCYDLQSIDLKNEGWRIEEILTRQDVYCTGCDSPDSGGSSVSNEDYFVVQLSHPELRDKIFAKCEYDLQDYPNVFIVTLVKMNFLNCFLSTFKKPLIYGQSSESVRIISSTVSNVGSPSLYISSRIEFIPESYFQSEKDTTLRLAIKLGKNSSNKVLAGEEYKPGHVYRFQEKSSYSLLRGTGYYYGMGFHDLLYLGRIDLGRYTITTRNSLIKRGLFTDIYDMPEINEWTKDKTLSARLGEVSTYRPGMSACMCINCPVDVFSLVNRSYIPDDNLLLKSIVESGDSMTEEEYVNHLAKVFSTSKGCSNAYARYIVLPATELTSDKRNHSFDLQLDQSERFKKTVTDKDKPAGYHIYTEITDLGEYVKIKSPVKKFMKNIMLKVEGKDKEITFKRLTQYIAAPDGSPIYGYCGSGVVNLDSYNLFSEEELNQLDPITFDNLKSNLTDLILKVLYLYCIDCSNYIVNSKYTTRFHKNVFAPEYTSIKDGLLKRLNDSLQVFWATMPGNSDIFSCKKTLKGLIVDELSKGAQKDDIVYRNNGIFDTIKKYRITESDFKKCAEFLS